MLKRFLDPATLTLSRPQSAGELTVLPLLRPGTAEPGYLTLGEALARGLTRVTEVSEGGSVPQLLFINDAMRPVLLLDGEELVGAKQNRVLNLTVLAPAHAKTEIPVSCIEQGRWHWRSRQFRDADRTLFATARAAKMAQVTESIRQGRGHRSDQGAIWESISEKSANFGTYSATGAASDIYESRREPLDQLVSQITPLPDQVGAAFIVRGRLVGAELFDSPRTFAQLLPKLVRSYGLDALDHSLPRDSAPAAVDGEFQAFLEQLLAAATLRRPAVGLGEDLRIEAKEMVAAALVHEGKVVHLSAFVRDR